MKRITLTCLAVLYCIFGLQAQNQNIFRIDYHYFTSEESETTPALQAWTNPDYLRVTAINESNIYIAQRTAGQAWYLIPESEEYIDLSDEAISEAPDIDLNTSETMDIAGYSCKLARIGIGTDEDTNEELFIKIWYTDKIPNVYWGEFDFLRHINGAALRIDINGNGFAANNVVKEKLLTSQFELPANYTEYTMDAYMEESDNQIAENRFIFRDESSELLGLKDEDGNIIAEAQFTYIHMAIDDIAIATKGDVYGVIDINGNEVLPFQYDYLSYNPDVEQFLYSINAKYGLMHKDGSIYIDAKYDRLDYMENGIAIFSMGDKDGLINEKGKVIVPATYDILLDRSKTHFIVVENDEYFLYSIKENKPVTKGFELLTFTDEPNLLLAYKDEKYGYVDTAGNTVIPFKFTSASIFTGGIATVAEDDDLEEFYLIDAKGERVELYQ
ncbi:WG repeat-containing protein [Sphingobacterium wenxiniae]|uniref:WG containing repeat-containing protein n=1 Tax=Sphingobacterium wenxiniae TaxID=683125 RepID=A0A1I6QDE9_9SPHI|nr:WG repeat-containing protein [Sphingobacterium wenxiniae]SFS50496.1 WG containing repeat-containing protein [Sphingobacterium wenxiniae]